MKEVVIIATGDELVNGDALDTSSQYYSKELAEIGLRTKSIKQVRDYEHEIVTEINRASSDADIIILSGGLGPTIDDITRFALATHLGLDLEVDEASIEHIRTRLKQFNIEYDTVRDVQALFPKGGTVFTNNYGTANGFHISFNKKEYFMRGQGGNGKQTETIEDQVRAAAQRKAIRDAERNGSR